MHRVAVIRVILGGVDAALAPPPKAPARTTMILYFRVLAGLMSLPWNLWFSHFCASGPDGMLEFNVAMLLRPLLSDLGHRHFCRGRVDHSLHVSLAMPE